MQRAGLCSSQFSGGIFHEPRPVRLCQQHRQLPGRAALAGRARLCRCGRALRRRRNQPAGRALRPAGNPPGQPDAVRRDSPVFQCVAARPAWRCRRHVPPQRFAAGRGARPYRAAGGCPDGASPRGVSGRRPFGHAGAAACGAKAPWPVGPGEFRRALRHLERPFRRTQRPRHLDLRSHSGGAGEPPAHRADRPALQRRARSPGVCAGPGRPDLHRPIPARQGRRRLAAGGAGDLRTHRRQPLLFDAGHRLPGPGLLRPEQERPSRAG